MKLITVWLAVIFLYSGPIPEQQDSPGTIPGPTRQGVSTPKGVLLPSEFAGWRAVKPPSTSQDPSAADPANANLLKEYGFTDFATAVYTRDGGARLTVKAARFSDASGSYGAFTYYELPQMLSETVKDQGASLNERVLFYRGNILIDAVFTQLTAMSTAELRELSDALPPAPGNAGNPPSLPLYLPRQSYISNSTKYLVGPIALEKTGAPLPAQLINFSKSAEMVTGQYNASAGKATLTLIEYPTPQIAIDELRQIDAASQASLTTGGNAGAAIYAKRTGPIIAVVSGAVSSSEAKSLLASVNYEANVTWNENTYLSRKNNVANLLVNVIILCGILGAMAVIAGIAFGGFRVLLQRLYPGVVFRKPEDEVISLGLGADTLNSPPSSRSNPVGEG